MLLRTWAAAGRARTRGVLRGCCGGARGRGHPHGQSAQRATGQASGAGTGGPRGPRANTQGAGLKGTEDQPDRVLGDTLLAVPGPWSPAPERTPKPSRLLAKRATQQHELGGRLWPRHARGAGRGACPPPPRRKPPLCVAPGVPATAVSPDALTALPRAGSLNYEAQRLVCPRQANPAHRPLQPQA